MKPKSSLRFFLVLAGSSIPTISALHAADGIWTADADGNWSNTANWDSGTVAEGTDFTALFDNIITGNRIVTLDTNRTIGNITAADTSHNYSIAGSLGTEILTLDTTTGLPEISVASGRTLTITSVVAGNDGLKKTGAGTLLLNAANTFTGGIELNAGRIQIQDGANEGTMLGASSNTLTFTGNAELYNSNNQATLPQGITINSGVTGTLGGAFGERTQVNGVFGGSGKLVVQGYSAGFDVELLSTANTFTGAIDLRSGDGVTLGVRSLVDSTGAGNISLQSSSNSGGHFEYMSGATSNLTLDNRQIELAVNGNSGTNLGRQAKLSNNSSSTTGGTFVVNTSLVVTGTGNKNFILGGGNTMNNAFNGDIVDAIGTSTLTLYKQDGGKWILGGQNTYEGNTIVDAGTLELADNASMLFMVGDDQVNNRIVGDASNATLNLNGIFYFDLTNASITAGDFWNIVDVGNLNESFSSTFEVFSTLGAFTQISDVWSIQENGTTYEFSEATGILTVIPEPRAALLGAIGLLMLLRRRR
jgi:autotransporter-associated beta strand protein